MSYDKRINEIRGRLLARDEGNIFEFASKAGADMGWLLCAVTQLLAKNAELQVVVDRLDKTEDGVPVVPYKDIVFFNNKQAKMIEEFKYSPFGGPETSEFIFRNSLKDCYSTYEAAAAARKAGD